MKKIVCIIGSDQKRGTFGGVQTFEKTIKELEQIKFEYVFLKQFHLEFCCGCKICFDKGEHLCPYQDDRDILIQKMEDADGVIFAIPNYAFHISARTKKFLDRIAFILHRPRFFNKSFTVIVSQGVLGGNQILKYLENIGSILGFEVVHGTCIRTLEPMTSEQKKKNDKKIKVVAKRFHQHLNKKRPLVPSLYKLMVFRMHRSNIQSLGEQFYDYLYCKEKGWFESDYYYKVHLGVMKRLLGRFFDVLGRWMGKTMQKNLEVKI